METIDYLIAQTFDLTALGTTVTDDAGAGRTVTTTAGSYRTFAARTAAGTGAADDPYELLYALTQLFGPTRWLFSLTAAGKVKVTSLNVAASSITWHATIAALLGFTSNVGPLATNASQTASKLPSHAVFFAACEDTGWQRKPGRFSGATLPSGKVYGWGDRLQGMTRKLTLRLLPKDDDARVALVTADPTSAPPTPCFGPMSRATSPGTGEPAQALPWGVVDTLGTAGARSLGVILGTLQTAITTPAGAAYDHCYLTPETVASGGEVRLSVEGYDPRRDVAGVELSYYASETRS